jgi:cytochrome b pre-mRNA-processing protein 3
MLKALKIRGERRRLAGQLCVGLSDRAREDVFFRDYQVPDTIDGRFDLLVLHAWMVLEQLRKQEDTALAQALVDALFVSFEEARVTWA